MRYSKMLTMIQQVLNKDSDVKIDFALTSKMANQIEVWSQLYEGKALWLSETVQSAELPAAIASEVARMITLELKSEVSGNARATYISGTYKKILSSLRLQTEYGCAKGGLIFKPYVTSKGIEVQYVQADSFFPIDFDGSGNMTKCVFMEQFRKGDKVYSRLEIHDLTGEHLKIQNRAFISTNDYSLGSEISIGMIDRWSELTPEAKLSGVDRLPFGYFKVPLANNQDTDSPLGVSVYSRAVGLIREADKRYSQINWEYDAKEAAVHIASNLLKYDQNRDKFNYPGGKDRLYREVEYNNGAVDKPFMDTFSPDIRDVSLFNGFNNQLKRIEFNCNLAYGTLSDPQNIDKTATEIKTSKQRSYTFVSDCQMALQGALEDTVKAIDFYCSLYDLAPIGSYKMTFDWDDSIVVDAETEREQDRKDLAAGIMRPEEYRAKWYGETEDQAAERLPKPALTEE
ncbi:phage portal protein [Lacrimispora sp.]|uniref:phage portal protein n=1 Tax=Lacrimispora sp. TaxID=2719234 RepID=UPI0028555D34|nr:phage portal protein [Lacrimispora sp.]MDR7814624.1 phage portal protein [Lacrimispora sp.]